MKRKVLALLLLVCTLVTNVSFGTLAGVPAQIERTEVHRDIEEQYALERKTIDNEVVVYVKSLDGTIVNTITNTNGTIRLDDKIVARQTMEHLLTPDSIIGRASTIKWGAWQNGDSGDISTGGLSTAIIAGVIASVAPWITVKVAAATAATVAGKYDTILIKYQIRYGYDDKYSYYERKSTFYGDGKKIGGPYTDKGKEYR